MENVGYIGLSREMVLRRQMDIIANNIANADSTAFRSEKALFEEFLIPSSQGQKMSFVSDFGILRNLEEGPLKPTGSPLDLAISGPGYFVVETEAGTRYTRNGHLQLDSEGTLVTPEGDPVLDDSDRPIVIDSSQSDVTISADGIVAIPGLEESPRIQIVEFENEQKLRKAGGSYYTTSETPLPSETSRIVQGMIEGSNVKPIVEMTKMISVLRAYQAIKGLLDGQHELQRRAIDAIGSVS